MSRARRFTHHAFSRPTVGRALRVATVVAPVLLLINHAESVLAEPTSMQTLRKLALNFVVPYIVSTWSSALAALAAER